MAGVTAQSYLNLCKMVSYECSIGQGVPTGTSNQSGELYRVVQWVAKAWVDIQNMSTEWRWMRSQFSVNTVIGDGSYAPADCTDTLTASAIDRFGHWIIANPYDPALAYLASAGVGSQYRLTFIPWSSFKQIYRVGTQNNSAPSHISIDPQNNLVIGPAPDAVYTITGDYQRAAGVLSVDADTPDMPNRFHDLVAWFAIEKYGYYDIAQEVIMRATAEKQRLLNALEFDQLDVDFMMGAPLA